MKVNLNLNFKYDVNAAAIYLDSLIDRQSWKGLLLLHMCCKISFVDLITLIMLITASLILRRCLVSLSAGKWVLCSLK